MSQPCFVATLFTFLSILGRTSNGQLPKVRLYSALIVGSARRVTKPYHLNFGFTSLLASSTGYPRKMTTKIDDAAARRLEMSGEDLKGCEEEKARLKKENQELRQENQLLKQRLGASGVVLGEQGNVIGQMAQTLGTQQSLLDHGVQISELKKANDELKKANDELRAVNQRLLKENQELKRL